jgi:hypothetical protein
MLNRSLTLTEVADTAPEFYLPEPPINRLNAIDTHGAIEVQIEALVELLHQLGYSQWVNGLLDKYEALAYAYDAFAESRNDAQAQIILQRLQRQLIRLHEYIETSPEDLWPRGP